MFLHTLTREVPYKFLFGETSPHLQYILPFWFPFPVSTNKGRYFSLKTTLSEEIMLGNQEWGVKRTLTETTGHFLTNHLRFIEFEFYGLEKSQQKQRTELIQVHTTKGMSAKTAIRMIL